VHLVGIIYQNTWKDVRILGPKLYTMIFILELWKSLYYWHRSLPYLTLTEHEYSTHRAYTCQHYSATFISKVYRTVSSKLLPHAIRLPTSHCCKRSCRHALFGTRFSQGTLQKGQYTQATWDGGLQVIESQVLDCRSDYGSFIKQMDAANYAHVTVHGQVF